MAKTATHKKTPSKKTASKATKKTAKKSTRAKKTIEPESSGLRPAETKAKPPAYVERLCKDITADGGAVLAPYREPLGGRWVVMSALPLSQVEPTPYQRGLSEAHVKRLADVIGRTGRYLDPIIAVRIEPKRYQTPNGYHRFSALKMHGLRAITALVMTEPEVCRLILALNVEKAHNLRDKCQEVIRLARDLAELPGTREGDFSLEFEEPSFLTLGMCYDQRGRFAGSAYHAIIKRADAFQDRPLYRTLEEREKHAEKLLQLDDQVGELVKALKDQGLESPYLKNFVVARLNPLRFQKDTAKPRLDDVLDKMLQAADRFKTDKIKPTDLARSGAGAGSAPDS